MKKKLIIACGSLIVALAVALPCFSLNQIGNSLMQQNLDILNTNEELRVKYVDTGTQTIIDDQGKIATQQWCYCYGEGTLSCPCVENGGGLVLPVFKTHTTLRAYEMDYIIWGYNDSHCLHR
jgi:hypothetical protein